MEMRPRRHSKGTGIVVWTVLLTSNVLCCSLAEPGKWGINRKEELSLSVPKVFPAVNEVKGYDFLLAGDVDSADPSGW